MESSVAGSIAAYTILAIAIAGLFAVVAWLIWGTIKGWRSTKTRSAEPMDWLRAMYPDHHALPTPTRRAPMMPRPRGWSWRRVAIYAAQAGVIGWLTWWTAEGVAAKDGTAPNYGGMLLGWIVVVAFGTALLTALWDWTHLKLQGLPFRLGRGFRALRRTVAPRRAINRHGDEAGQAGRALRFGGEASERLPHLRIGE